MRLICGCILAIVIAFAVPQVVEGRQLSQTYTLTIEVECIDDARNFINGLNGYNVDSNVIMGGQRHANIVRRVDSRMFRAVQEELREMGEVLNESENARYVGANILNLDTRILVLTQEMERLSVMMAASESLEVLIAVNDHMSSVTRQRDDLIGQRNGLRSQAESSVIHINLVENREDILPIPPPSFGNRVSNSFSFSVNITRSFFEEVLVLAARVSVPLAIWFVIGGIVLLVFSRRAKKRRASNEVT